MNHNMTHWSGRSRHVHPRHDGLESAHWAQVQEPPSQHPHCLLQVYYFIIMSIFLPSSLTQSQIFENLIYFSTVCYAKCLGNLQWLVSVLRPLSSINPQSQFKSDFTPRLDPIDPKSSCKYFQRDRHRGDSLYHSDAAPQRGRAMAPADTAERPQQ